MKNISLFDIFSARELEVLADLAKRLDLPEERVLVSALRSYQLISAGTHSLTEVDQRLRKADVKQLGSCGAAVPPYWDRLLGCTSETCYRPLPCPVHDGEERRETISHPRHYGGDTVYEAIKVIEAWSLGFCLGNAAKYICRAETKGMKLEDLKKARWYLDREIQRLDRTDKGVER